MLYLVEDGYEMPSDNSHPHPIEVALGYIFRDKSLLEMAMTHSSYAEEAEKPHNERLEFLGDSIISSVVTPMLYQLAPAASEGQLNAVRARIISERGLASLARHLNIGLHLHLGKSEIMANGCENERLLCSALEALVGAVFLDANYKTTARVFSPLIEPGARALCLTSLNWQDPRSELQERLQAAHDTTPIYKVMSESGPSHAPLFTVSVSCGDAVLATATGSSKAKAKLAAAKVALHDLAPDVSK
jgi:ribonuclease-3